MAVRRNRLVRSLGVSVALVAIALLGARSAAGANGALASFPTAVLASPAPGDLDRSFGDHGKVLTRFKSKHSASAVAIGESSRIVVAGGPPFSVARYRPNGRLDHSFSNDGKVQTKFDSVTSDATAVAITGHGKVVVAGGASVAGEGPGVRSFVIARYKANGHLDRSFSGNGKARLKTRGAGSALAVGVDSRGRIVAAGFANPGGELIRLEPDGRLDDSFGHHGKVTTKPHGGFVSLAIDSSDRILVGQHDGGVYRYRPTGKLDRSFGKGGIGSGWTLGDERLTLDDRQRVVTVSRNVVSRLTPDGQPDPSFGTNGRMKLKSFRYGWGVAVDGRGRPVVLGSSYYLARRLEVARLRPTGVPDDRFGHNGIVATDFPGPHFFLGGIAVDQKNRIVGVGGAKGRFALARYVGS